MQGSDVDRRPVRLEKVSGDKPFKPKPKPTPAPPVQKIIPQQQEKEKAKPKKQKKSTQLKPAKSNVEKGSSNPFANLEDQ